MPCLGPDRTGTTRRVPIRLDSARRVRCLVPVVVGLMAMLLPAAAGALPPTGIKGRVTDSNTHEPISGSEVCAVSNGGGSEKVCEHPNGSGEYKIEGLKEEEYLVEFTAPAHTSLTHPVTVKTNEVAEVNAELEVGEGAVAGRVTNASSGQGTGGVEVCGDESRHCVETNGNGEYTLSGLPAGSHTVYFSPAEACEEEQGEKTDRCQLKSNYLGQSSSVTVKANQTATADVALQVGGQISGTVTNASITHPGLAKVRVCATRVQGTAHEYEEYEGEGCAVTSSSGQYTISGLGSGAYKVEFSGEICTIPAPKSRECSETYVTRFYHGKPTHKQAETIPVTTSSNTGSINESLLEGFPTTPASTTAPALTGTAAVGQALTCLQGSWSHEPTYLLYQWLRNGTVISGQTGATYTLQAADQDRSITCSITAGNGAGATVATSKAVVIPVPLAVFAGVKVKGTVASVTLRCPGPGSCSGVMKIFARVAKSGKHKKSNVTIGVASFSMGAGKRVTLHVHLTGSGGKLLRHAGGRGLEVQITGTGVKAHNSVLKK
jgi:Carboxypeptidase regulatory-like domain